MNGQLTADIHRLLEDDVMRAETGRDLDLLLSEQVLPAALSVRDDLELDLVLAAMGSHPVPEVRAALADVLRSWLPDGRAVDMLFTLATDPDDIVCLRAMRVAGEERVDGLAEYLIDIVGRPSEAVYSSKSPVGRGAAHAVAALRRILGADSPHQLAAAEHELELHHCVPERLDAVLAVDLDVLEKELGTFDDQDMVLVPGGWSKHGLAPEAIPDRTFSWPRSVPERNLWLPPFLIDRYPVTVEAYDAFAQAVLDLGHAPCHPLEPEGKDHRRNTRRDQRVGARDPVTGIDWFDAFAYARWCGKQLPTEYQWERAARGPDDRVWPWGDDWEPGACNWFGTAFGVTGCTLAEWRDLLARTDRVTPNRTTRPVDEFEDFASGYGVVDMVGDCWEWTRSELATGRHYSPSLHHRRNDVVSVVLKGGAWSSLPGQLFPSFRGQDAPYCRHDEIGFRCVRQVPIADLRRLAGGQAVENSAIY